MMGRAARVIDDEQRGDAPHPELPDLTEYLPGSGWGGRGDPTQTELRGGAGRFSRSEAEESLEACRRAIQGQNGLTARVPPKEGEGPQDYVDRLFVKGPREAGGLFWKAAAARAHIARLDREEREQEEQRQQREADRDTRIVEDAQTRLPDLQAAVTEAQEAEKELAALFAHVKAAARARKARTQIETLNRRASEAAEALGRDFEPVHVEAAPDEAEQMLRLLAANKPSILGTRD